MAQTQQTFDSLRDRDEYGDHLPKSVGVPYQPHSPTSREAAEKMVQVVPNLQAQVLGCIAKYGPITDSQINERLGAKGNGIRPRRVELLHLGLIKEHSVVMQANGRRASAWVVA